MTLRHKHRYIRQRLLPKPDGSFRKLLVPTGRLRDIQDLCLNYLTSKDPKTGKYPTALLACHTAFKRGSSALRNAREHEPYAVSVKFDIRKFFDSVPANPVAAGRQLLRIEKLRPGRRRTPVPAHLGDLQIARKSKYVLTTQTVEGSLLLEGIAPDIAKFIAEIASFRGFLYQGSPLSPLLANLVTKHGLCPTLMVVASVYDLPIYTLGRSGYVVIPHVGETAWYTGVGPDDPLLGLLHAAARNSPACRATGLGSFDPGLNFLPMEPRVYTDGQVEPLEQMLLRYGNAAWTPRKPRAATEIRAFFLTHCAITPAEFRLHPLGRTKFTLYADDGVISSNNPRVSAVRHILRPVLECRGFRLNSKKGVRTMRRGRYITGYEVSPAPVSALDPGPRVSKIRRDQDFRRPLHHLRTGRLALTEENIMRFNGKLAWLKQSNPNAWAKYARALRDLVRASGASDEIKLLVRQYEGL